MAIRDYYIDEVKKTVDDIKKSPCDLTFAVVSDTHLDNSLGDTLANISETDKSVKFDFLIHLGDYLNGNIPHDYTERILKDHVQRFSSSVSGDFYPVQGNHDGFTDFRHNDMATDELWEAATGHSKPYYFVDIHEKEVRLIILCTTYYTFKDGEFSKGYGISDEQLEWLKTEALDIQPGWTVMVFSHEIPFKDFSDNALSDTTRINGTKALELLISAKEKIGFDIAAWIVGDTHGEFVGKACGINVIIVGNETAYVPQLWSMPDGGWFEDRKLGTVTEDLWDAVTLDKKSRELKFFRFGAGRDRSLKY